MKILYYSPHAGLSSDAPSGYGVHMREMMAAFRALGHDVRELIAGDGPANNGTGTAPSGRGPRRRLKRWMPKIVWETLRDAATIRFDRKMRRRLQKEMDDYQPDLLFERAAYLQDSGVRVAKGRQCRHILEMNAPYLEEKRTLAAPSLLQFYARTIERDQVSLPHRIAVLSETLGDYYVDKFGLAKSRFLVTPMAANLDFGKGCERASIPFSADHTVVGYVGSMFPWHRLNLLVEAFSGLEKEISRLRLLLVGDGVEFESLKHRVGSLGLNDKVHFAGRVPLAEVPEYMATIDIAIQPGSAWHASSTKLFEYAVMNKPVIFPNTAPMKELVRDGVDGYLCPPQVQPIADRIERLACDPKLGRTLARSMRDRIEPDLTWGRIAQRILDACQSA